MENTWIIILGRTKIEINTNRKKNMCVIFEGLVFFEKI